MMIGQKLIGETVYTRFWQPDDQGEGGNAGRWTTIPWMVVHRGKPSEDYDDSFLGGTILMACPPFRGWTVSVDRYDGKSGKCDYSMTNAHRMEFQASSQLGRFYNCMDPAILAQVKTVKIPYRIGDSGTEVATGADGLEAKLWMPSIAEISLGQNGNGDYWVTEGAMFDYWKGKSYSDYMEWKPTTLDESQDDYWFTRTPVESSENRSFMAISTDAGYGGRCYAPMQSTSSNREGLTRPCMVVPDEMMLDSHSRLVISPTVGSKTGGVWHAGQSSSKVEGVWRETAHIAAKIGGIWKE